MNETGIGVVYDLKKSKANDGFHIETCGPEHYIISVKDRNGGSCIIGMSRTQADAMACAVANHVEYMTIMKKEEEE